MGSERIALGSWNSGGWAFSDRLLNRFFRLHQCSFHNFYCSNGLVEVFECPEHQPRKMKKSCDTWGEKLPEALRRTGSTERCVAPAHHEVVVQGRWWSSNERPPLVRGVINCSSDSQLIRAISPKRQG